MDIGFWAASINSARHLSAVQTNRLTNYGNQEDTHLNADAEGEEDVRAWFPCPFCYVEIEVQMLCDHFQEEHCFDFKNAVCPICAATLGKDPLGHFTLQHAQSVKRRRKYQKPGFWNNTTAISVKDPHEMNSFFCTNLMGRYNGQEPATDPLLLPFLCNVAHSDTKDGVQDKSSGSVAATPDIESCHWNKQRIYVAGVLSLFLNPRQANFLRNKCMPFKVVSASFWGLSPLVAHQIDSSLGLLHTRRQP